MASGKRFRWQHLPPEDREQWNALLRGELMDRLYAEPAFPLQRGRYWTIVGIGVFALLLWSMRRFGDLWMPPASWQWALVASGCVSIAAFGIFALLQKRRLAQLANPTPGRYLLPVGYLDTSDGIWEFVSIQEMTSAQLEDTRHPVSRLPASVCRLILKDKRDISFVIPSMDQAEEITDIMLMLIGDDEEVIDGLNQRMEQFATLADIAASVQDVSVPQPEDRLISRLSLWLRFPIVAALIVGLCLGGMALQLRNSLHVSQQIGVVLKDRDVAAARMVLRWATETRHRRLLRRFIRQRYEKALSRFQARSSGAAMRQKKWAQALIRFLMDKPNPVIPIHISYRSPVGMSTARAKEIDAVFRGKAGVRIKWSLAAYVRTAMGGVFPPRLVKPIYGDPTSSMFFYFMVGDEESRRMHRRAERIAALLSSCSVCQQKSASTVSAGLSLALSFQPFPTGQHYQIHALGKQMPGEKRRRVVIEKKRYPALSFRVEVVASIPGEAPLRFRVQLPPAGMLGFYQKAKPDHALRTLLSGIQADGAGRVYALMASAAWRKLKQYWPNLLQGKAIPQYALPVPRRTTPTSTPTRPSTRPATSAPTSRPSVPSSRPVKERSK